MTQQCLVNMGFLGVCRNQLLTVGYYSVCVCVHLVQTKQTCCYIAVEGFSSSQTPLRVKYKL